MTKALARTVGSESTKATAKANAEQRKFSRVGYKQVQRIAPLVDDRVPVMDDFAEVQCNDVSGGGLSFYADEAPHFKQCIVELTARDVVRYFVARVANVRKNTNRKYKPVIVGCRFAGVAPVPERSRPERTNPQRASRSTQVKPKAN